MLRAAAEVHPQRFASTSHFAQRNHAALERFTLTKQRTQCAPLCTTARRTESFEHAGAVFVGRSRALPAGIVLKGYAVQLYMKAVVSPAAVAVGAVVG